MAPLTAIIRESGFVAVSYADDTLIVVSLASDVDQTAKKVKSCMSQIKQWMPSNCLKLNVDKREVMLLGSDANVWTPEWWPDSLGNCLSPVQKVRNLGVTLDSKPTFDAQASKLTSAVWYILKMIRKLLPYIPLDTRKTVVTALALSRLDYGNALYTGAQVQIMAELQRLQNAAARLVLDIPKHDPIAHRLEHLHWLPIPKRVVFK